MALLTLKGVSLCYHSAKGETQALRDVTFDVQEGEFFGIVGPSGSGKTTILSLIAGLIKPSTGRIEFAENGKRTGYMLQRDHLFEWRTIEQNVRLGLEISGTLNAKTAEHADKLLEKYGLGEFKTRHPSELSGGMRQRVALIRTLVTEPDILLLDEPFSALDFVTRLSAVSDVFSIIKNEGKTALLVTHDISEAISMCDRIALLSARPAEVKRIFTTGFSKESPIARRKSENFSKQFDKIWREMGNETA